MSTEETRDNIAPEAQEEMSEESLNELRKIRRDKLKALQEAGRNPFLEEKWDVTAHSKDIKDNSTPWKIRRSHAPEESWLSETWEKRHL